MKVADEYDMDAIGMRELLKVGTRLNLGADAAETRANHIRENLAAAFSTAAGTVTGNTKQTKFAKKLANTIHAYTKQRG